MLDIGEFDRIIVVSATVDPKIMTFHILVDSGDPRLTSQFDNWVYVPNNFEYFDDLAIWLFWVELVWNCSYLFTWVVR